MTRLLGPALWLAVALGAAAGVAFAGDNAAPQVKAVPFDNRSYVPLLEGPDTYLLHSGLVTLQPGKSVGQHTTGTNEEMLIPLEGAGELRCEGHPPMALKPGMVTYAPPNTRHDVLNTGTTPLRYIYVTAKTGWRGAFAGAEH